MVSLLPKNLRGGMFGLVLLMSLAGVLMLPCPAQAANIDPRVPEPVDLAELSLEELMNMPVISPNKREQPFSETAAALFVLTQDDIRRSGATSIPEALRMVPGIQVAKIDSNKWAISSRGFNGRFANKLLVLIDGRTVYSPTYAGVNWDVQDTMLDDIERIEVIRGPGATLWGVNAVNGVINIITKKAKDTQGGLLVGGAGTEERGFAGLRYGTKLSDNTHIRAYGKFFARDNQALPTGDPASDRWDQARGGMRMDHTANNGDFFTLQGDYYDGRYRETAVTPILTSPFTQKSDFTAQTKGGNLLGRWTRQISTTSGLSLQAYYDRVDINSGRGGVISDTADLNFQHYAAWGDRHNFIWGLGYRFVNNQTPPSPIPLSTTYTPESRSFSVWSGFIQDDITLLPKTVTLTLGTKVEHNDFTGFVVQPSVRLRWTPTDRQTVWAAVSRAIRTPSHSEDDIRINQPTGLPTLVAVFGSRAFDNEKVVAYEAGYRNQITRTLSVDIATFYNNYNDLRSFEPGTPFRESTPSPTHVVLPLIVSNLLGAQTYGVEASVDWRPVEWWRIQPSYTYLHMSMEPGLSKDPSAGSAPGESPAHQASLRSLMSLPYKTELDVWGRYTDHLAGLSIPSYFNLDVRLGWKPTSHMEVSLAGQNLLDSHRPEFTEKIISFVPSQIQRGVYGKITWRW